MVPSGDDGMDLSKVTTVCKQILREPNSQQLTGRELRQKIAKGIGVDETLLASDTIQHHIDAIVLEHFVGSQVEPPCSLGETAKSIKVVGKEKDKPRPKKAKIVASNVGDPTSRGDTARRARSSPSSPSRGSTSGPSKAGDKIERLKTYITRCGVRKIWKRELDGLSERQQIARLEKILHHDLGMEGRPTLEKCKSIKERREFEEELRALDPKNVLPTKLRSQRSQPHPGIKDHGNGIDGEDNGSGGSNDHDDGDCDDGDDDAPRLSRPAMRPRLDLSALGDPEEENDDD